MSKISDERREVAARLRSGIVARNIPEAYVAIVQSIGVRPCLLLHDGESGDRFDRSAYELALSRLADLIDPQERTCHFVFRDESYSTPDGYEQDGTYYCSACGCDLPDWMQEHVDDIQAGKIENDIARCPICGARLVSK